MTWILTDNPVLNEHQEAVRTRILKITTALERELGLDGYLTIRHNFATGYDGDDSLDNEGLATVYKTTATTTPQWEYRYALITWYIATAATQTDDELIAVALHEYLHIILSPIATLLPSTEERPGIDKLEEFVTESLMRVIGHARGMDNIR
jgi:hypothetical protein